VQCRFSAVLEYSLNLLVGLLYSFTQDNNNNISGPSFLHLSFTSSYVDFALIHHFKTTVRIDPHDTSQR
jgi:hypothetical protein